MTIKSTTIFPVRFPLAGTTRPAALRVVLKAFSIWRERQHLGNLDAHLLRDIGVTRSDAVTETKRALWDAPNRWQR